MSGEATVIRLKSEPYLASAPVLALLLSFQAGYDAGVPLSLDGDDSVFQHPLDRSFKGARIAWGALLKPEAAV